METEAGIFTAEAACPLLADAVGDMDDALGYLRVKIAAAGTVDQPQGAEPGDRESPFNSAGVITIDTSGASPGVIGRIADAIRNALSADDGLAAVDAAPLKSEAGVAAMLYLERADGECVGYDPSQIDLMLLHGDLGNGQGILAQKGADKDAYVRRAMLLAGLRAVKAEYPDAFAAIRCSGASSVSKPDAGKLRLLIAPYGRTANLGNFDERYRPGCFSDGGMNGDLRVLAFHAESNNYVLGRVKAGTARFWEDEHAGIFAEATVPDTTWARDLMTSVERGDIDQASASFYITKATYETTADGRRVRWVERAILVDGSVESQAAYPGTVAAIQPQSQQAASETNKHRLEIRKRRVI
jgi:HK97 family phage prohead protease